MTLLDAKEYDEAAVSRRRRRIVAVVSILIILGFLGYRLRFWPEEHLVEKFFTAVQKQDYETAYGIYMADPGWKQHPQQHPLYPFNEFYQDWGPGGEWGLIKNFRIYASGECPKGGNGVIVEVVVNGRAEHEQLYVQKSDKTFSPSPCS